MAPTSEQIVREIAALLVAHPSGPKPPNGDALLIDEAPGGYPRIVDTRGLVWRQDGEGWALDLWHAATAGVLLAALWEADPDWGWHAHGPPGRIHIHDAREGSPDHFGGTLGEAVARALLAVWPPA